MTALNLAGKLETMRGVIGEIEDECRGKTAPHLVERIRRLREPLEDLLLAVKAMAFDEVNAEPHARTVVTPVPGDKRYGPSGPTRKEKP